MRAIISDPGYLVDQCNSYDLEGASCQKPRRATDISLDYACAPQHRMSANKEDAPQVAVGQVDRAMRKIVVWDMPTRLFHWLTVMLVAAGYATWRLNWMDWHAYAGYALLALVVFRLLWGFFGSETARFARFIAAPRRAACHLVQLFRREPDHQVGHNPAGGWMVLLLLALLLAETLTGIYTNNDVADVGPFTELTPVPVANFITTLHDVLWQALWWQ